MVVFARLYVQQRSSDTSVEINVTGNTNNTNSSSFNNELT
jgi:hypothetical protein